MNMYINSHNFLQRPKSEDETEINKIMGALIPGTNIDWMARAKQKLKINEYLLKNSLFQSPVFSELSQDSFS